MRQEEVGARYMEQLINNPKAFIKEMQGKSGVMDDLVAFFKGYNKYSKNLSKSEKKAINKVYNEFLDAMKETATAKESDTRYAILTDNNGDFVIADNNILLNNPNNLPVHELIRKNIMSHVGEIHKVLAYGDEVYLGKDLPDEYTQSKYTKALLKHAVSRLKAKNIISSNLGELIEIADNKTYSANSKQKHNKDAKNGWYKYDTRFAIEKQKGDGTNDGANIYTGTLVVKHADDNKMYLYDVTNIKKSSPSLTATELAQLWAAKNAARKSPFSNNYAQNSQNVNTFNQKGSKNSQNNTNVSRHSLPETDSHDIRYSLSESEYETVLENLNEFKSVDELKSYFDTVQSNINEKYRKITPHTMKELNDNERNRVNEVIKAAELEKEAIKKWRSAHKVKKTVDLDTKAKIEATDKRYTQAIKDGDLDTARELVEQMAFLKGYSVTDYQIDHKAPTNDGYNARLYDVTSMYGEDIYGKDAARYFGTYEGFDNESIRHIQEARNNPNKRVTIYRAVPSSVKGDQIRNGDWITLTYDYAKKHGENNIIGSYKIIKKTAQAKDIYTDGNSIHEFGYDDGNNYYYGDTTNYRKLADVITFDDEGNPIRLRDRFNFRNDDIRYSLSEKDIDKYTTAQYNNFGWVRANDVLTARQWSDFNHKYNEIKFQNYGEVHKSSNGEYIVAVNDMTGDSFGVDNVLVFVKGSPDDPKVTQVIKINSNDETEIDSIRREIYESKGISSYYYFEGVLERSTLQDFPRWETRRRNDRQSGGDTSEVRNGRRSVESDRRNGVTKNDKESGNTLFSLPEDKKVYTKASAKRIFNDIVESELRDKYHLTYEGKKGLSTELIYEVFNNTTEGKKLQAATDIAEYFVQRAVFEDATFDVADGEVLSVNYFKTAARELFSEAEYNGRGIFFQNHLKLLLF